MPATGTHGIGEQSSSYRRGMVLGLTMAEVGILIIFVLLLLIGLTEWLREREAAELSNARVLLNEIRSSFHLGQNASALEVQRIVQALNEAAATPEGRKALDETQAVLREIRQIEEEMKKEGAKEGLVKKAGEQSYRIANQAKELKRVKAELADAKKLVENLPLLNEIKASLGLGENPTVDEIQRMIRVMKEVAESPKGASTLKEARDVLAQIRRTRQEIEKAGGSETLARQVEQQSFRLANQEGQLARYESALKEAGTGKGERPCWVRPDGTIEYLYDVVLQNDGIRMREYTYENRKQERSYLPLPSVNPKEVLTISEFMKRTEPLYNHSLAQNCRFFVVVYDGTGPAEKERYKQLLRAVEGHFYKRLDRGRPPF